eukprot:gnl/TRDRNA2_/TRDRNA2_44548_c0_seq1.p1 gnl/TRDRNA2_/TRDRNA2_44548_c0~~gnl/TRDRNA2_/TRDRNA2_44548_c0_seq1.p1  ORF type:complete len:449 (-),score=78.02 gnl/TRDRNA2_/TRDRNA2_44548_c0_seq1:69-1415(-)
MRVSPWLLALSTFLTRRSDAVLDPWNVLILGGTGFKGHPTTERLVKEGHNVTVLSRGSSYWGILDDLKGKINHLKCNRTIDLAYGGAKLSKSSGLVNCTGLQRGQGTYDAVVDFSSRTVDELKQVTELLKRRVGIYIFLSSHSVYTVSKNRSQEEEMEMLREEDAIRPGRDVSPLERYALKAKSVSGDNMLECEEHLLEQFNAGGFPFVALRAANVFGPKENTIRYWLLHLWIRAHLALTLPMHLDETMLETPISMTYTLDIASAVVKVIHTSKTEKAEEIWGQAFNLASEEAPTQRTLYNLVAEPIYVPYVETTEVPNNRSIVLYPEIVRGPISSGKAHEFLRWSSTDLRKALRSVARFYDRVMVDQKKFKWERDSMYEKTKKMLGSDGSRFVSWTRAFYLEKSKTDLYDELDDEDEEELLSSRRDPDLMPKKRKQKARAKKKKGEL